MLDEDEVLSDWHPNEALSSQTIVAMTHGCFICCLVCLWVVVQRAKSIVFSVSGTRESTVDCVFTRNVDGQTKKGGHFWFSGKSLVGGGFDAGWMP